MSRLVYNFIRCLHDLFYVQFKNSTIGKYFMLLMLGHKQKTGNAVYFSKNVLSRISRRCSKFSFKPGLKFLLSQNRDK